jgi:hypothetical protein
MSLIDSLSLHGRRKGTSQDTPLPSFVKMTSEEALNPRTNDDSKLDVPNGRIIEMKTYDFQTSALGASSERV